MTTRPTFVAALMLLATACGEDPTLEGVVVDPWGEPVAGAEVTASGIEAQAKADGKGEFKLPFKKGSIEFEASREGYISRSASIEATTDEETDAVAIKLIPEPETDGYHAVGAESFVKLAPQPVIKLGNELKSYHGIRSAGDLEFDGKAFRVVFHTPLKMDQVARLDIEIHKLDFVESTEVGTVDGVEEVDLHMWIDGGEVEYEKEQAGSDDNYIFRADELPSGTYAFVSMGLLDATSDSFEKMPAEVRVVHPFTIK